MKKNLTSALLFIAAALFLFFFLIPQIPLWSSDEGRFADIARSMHVSGNWIVPFFNGLPYLEKPAFASWTTALAYHALGTNALATRLPGILSALGGLILAFIFMRRLFGKTAAGYAVLCLMTTVGYVLVGRFAVIDMQMVFLLSASIFLLMLGVFEQKNYLYLAAGVFMGLTFLTKGLIGGALPAIIFFTFLAFTGRWKEFKKIHILLLTFLIFLAVSIPWVLAMLKRQPEFLDVFIFEHHFKRFTTSTFGRKRPFWFFTYILPIISFPWCLFLPAAIASAWKSEKIHKEKMLFFILWAIVIFVFFSIPHSKLPYYIVPAAVPLALFCGVFLSRWIQGEDIHLSPSWMEWTWRVTCAIFIAGAAGINISLLFSNKVPELQLIRAWVPLGALLLGIGGIEAFYFFKKGRRRVAILTLAASTYLCLIVVVVCMLKLSPIQSTVNFADIIRENSKPDDIVAVFSSPDRFSDLPFYLERRVAIVGADRGTLNRESRQQENAALAEGGFYEIGVLLERIQNEKTKRIFCLLEKDRLPELLKQGMKDYRIWMESYDRVLISNF